MLSLPCACDDDDDIGDDQLGLARKRCKNEGECPALKSKWDECQKRVEEYPDYGEDCVEEFLDYMHCVDTCVSLDFLVNYR